jgi:competence transcription factor ComK
MGVTVLSLGIIWILMKWVDWLKRMRFRTSVNFERMTEIEQHLGMSRHTMCHELDQKNRIKNQLDQATREELERKNELFKYSKASGFDGLILIARILQVIWLSSLAVVFILVINTILTDC